MISLTYFMLLELLIELLKEESNPQGLRFSKSHKKQMSIWNKLHQLTVKDDDGLSQYDSMSTNNKIIEVLKIGLEDAHVILQGLSMQPKRHTKASWWFKPWIGSQCSNI